MFAWMILAVIKRQNDVMSASNVRMDENEMIKRQNDAIPLSASNVRMDDNNNNNNNNLIIIIII